MLDSVAAVGEIRRDVALRGAGRLVPGLRSSRPDHRPPLLAVWGRNDSVPLPKGTKAFPGAPPLGEIEFYDIGHLALEMHVEETFSTRICRFLNGHVSGASNRP